MSDTVLKGHDKISLVHRMALLEEIGERLRSDLARNRTELPQHLLQLMKRFRLAG